MVLTRAELLASLKNEARILIHLAGKVDPKMLDYRPTPKQRSMLELLQYLTFMGPTYVDLAKSGHFDPAAWAVLARAASALTFDQVMGVLAAQGDDYEKRLASLSDSDMRAETELFGRKQSRGSFLVNVLLCSCAAYRMQLFIYLKSCGCDDLSTTNLWGGMDAPPPKK